MADSEREQAARNRTEAHLMRAIETMQDACDQAKRLVEQQADKATACRYVLHSLAWGFANASSSIESALVWVEEAHAAANSDQPES